MLKIEQKKQLFVQKLHKYGADKYSIPKNAFRINKLRTSDSEKVLSELKQQGFEFDKVSFPHGYVLTKEPFALSSTSQFISGHIYIQNLSSMIPVLALDPKPEERILDLCAAPGSKTSLMADLCEDACEITAVESNYARFIALKSNLSNLGVKNVQFLKANGASVPHIRPDLIGYFDKVLLDAPCSNEGLIAPTDERKLAKWNPKSAKKLSNLQKKLISAGLYMLKPGGTLIYSTCTYSEEENEEVVVWARKKFPRLVVNDLVLLKKLIPNSKDGLITMDADLKKSMRILPENNFSGFYVCSLTHLA